MKSLPKILSVLFLIILAGLLITHFVILRNVRAEFADKEAALNSQMSDLEQQVGNISAENQMLNVQLGIAKIKDDVISSNYGTARESVSKLRAMLVDGGCKKMDLLNPVFKDLDTVLMKKNDEGALSSLDQISKILLAD